MSDVYSKKMLINLDMGNNEIIGLVPEIVTDLPTTGLKVGRIVVKGTSAYICVATTGDVIWKELTSVADGEAYVTEAVLFNKTEGSVTIKDALIPNLEISKITGLQDALDKIVQSAEFATVDTPVKIGTAIQIPKDLSKYDNTVSEFITKAVADLVNYYTKAEEDAKHKSLQEQIDAINSFEIQVVTELPATGVDHTLYFVPQDQATDNIYDEFIYVNKKWEKIGSTAFKLTISQDGTGIKINDQALQVATASQPGLMTAEQVTALAGKVDAETGKRLMTDAEGTKLAGIEEGAQVNVIESVEVAGVTATIADKKATIALDDASESASGLMPASAVTKLKNIEEGANKTVVDSALTDEGTNPVQGKVVKEAIDTVATELTEFKKLPFGYVYAGTIGEGVTSKDFALPDGGAKEVASVTVIDSTGAEVIPAIIVGTKTVKVAFNSATADTYTVKVIVY